MATRIRGRRSRSTRKAESVQKPRGVIHPRVQNAGPERFAIVSVDCAKARSKWMFADFYGRVLVPPTVVEHNRPALAGAILKLNEAVRKHRIADVIVAVERTSRHHELPFRAFQQAGFEVRVVHPFTTRQFRQPSDPGNKTDDTDLAAIHRAATCGFALQEPHWDDSDRELQLLVRHRRDLVRKRSALQCQIRESLSVALPGFAECFGSELWESRIPWMLLQHAGSYEVLRALQHQGLARLLREHGIRFQERTLDKLVGWAGAAAAPGQAAAQHLAIALELHDDQALKTGRILTLEQELAARLVHTPYVLLMSIPGINVVSAAECAGEMGPIRFYPTARAITGRAGIRPSRYQSDQVDRPDGPLVKRCTRAAQRADVHRRQPRRVQPALPRAGGAVESAEARSATDPHPHRDAVHPDCLSDGQRATRVPTSRDVRAKLDP
jgi:transposase